MERVWRQLELPGSVDWPRLGGNSFERRSESERMENGGAPGGESSATRCSTVKWERAGVSAREEPREEERRGGALKAQSGYNAGQGRKAAVSKPPPFRGSSARRDPLLFPARGGNYVSTFGWKKGRGGMKSARFRKLLSDGILNRRSRLSLSEIILARLFALYRLRILINRG